MNKCKITSIFKLLIVNFSVLRWMNCIIITLNYMNTKRNRRTKEKWRKCEELQTNTTYYLNNSKLGGFFFIHSRFCTFFPFSRFIWYLLVLEMVFWRFWSVHWTLFIGYCSKIMTLPFETTPLAARRGFRTIVTIGYFEPRNISWNSSKPTTAATITTKTTKTTKLQKLQQQQKQQ